VSEVLEDFVVQQFVALPAEKALDQGIFLRLAGRDVMPVKAGSVGPARMAREVSSGPLSLTIVFGAPRRATKESARMVFTDPPYNAKIDGHVGGAGKIKHREFAMVRRDEPGPVYPVPDRGPWQHNGCQLRWLDPLRLRGLASYK